jgi:hypothetical protein
MAGFTQAKLPRTRRDRSGAIRRALTGMLESGELLYSRAEFADTPERLEAFRVLHQQWVLSALPGLKQGFERESVSEFLHANACLPADRRGECAARAAANVMRDALELLHGLRATLEYDCQD